MYIYKNIGIIVFSYLCSNKYVCIYWLQQYLLFGSLAGIINTTVSIRNDHKNMHLHKNDDPNTYNDSKKRYHFDSALHTMRLGLAP